MIHCVICLIVFLEHLCGYMSKNNCHVTHLVALRLLTIFITVTYLTLLR